MDAEIKFVELEKIVVKDRQRTSMAPAGLQSLADSIVMNGLKHPVGVHVEPDKDSYVLNWGGRRTAAIKSLAEKGLQIHFGDLSGPTVPLGSIPVIVVKDNNPLTLARAELAENVDREELPWQDRIAALAKIHELAKIANPTQTVADTAREIASQLNVSPTTLQRSVSVEAATHGSMSIPMAAFLAPHLNDPEVKRATSMGSAFQIVTRRLEEKATAALVAKRQAKTASSSDIIYKFGDMQQLILEIPNRSVDLIFTDPPYGVNADQANFSRRQAQKHTYQDSPEYAKDHLTVLLREAWRVAKDRANIFIFLDWKYFEFVHDTAAQQAWTPFPTPVIWDKLSHGAGPWQGEGFLRRYEVIFFATKGRKGLLAAIDDIIPCARVPTEERRHAAQKPVELLKKLIEISTLPGEVILDPFAGSASTLIAAKELRRKAIGFENDADVFAGGQTALFNTGEKK